MDTPEFLVWALEFSCPIRGFQNGSDPERIERQLRAARAVSDARREGRVLDGVCVDPPNGFRIDDALTIYGGLQIVEQICGPCPANAGTRIVPDTLAGCYGILPIASESQIASAVERTLNGLDFVANYSQLFTPTQPRWYGLWTRMPLQRNQLSFVVKTITALDASGPDATPLCLLRAGLQTAMDANLPFHATLYPSGRVEGTSWRLMPHCQRCKAPWNETRLMRCAVCDYEGRPAPDRMRKARGSRPYFPLSRLLGNKAAADFLVRYDAFRKQRGSTPPAQIPPHEALLDNLPAD